MVLRLGLELGLELGPDPCSIHHPGDAQGCELRRDCCCRRGVWWLNSGATGQWRRLNCRYCSVVAWCWKR